MTTTRGALHTLKLKNWRSLREVEIDFAPLTVLIGANASGKSNILDALYFLRDCQTSGAWTAIADRGGSGKIHTLGVNWQEPIELEMAFSNPDHYTYRLGIQLTESDDATPDIGEWVSDQRQTYLQADYQQDAWVWDAEEKRLIAIGNQVNSGGITALSGLGQISTYFPVLYATYQFMTKRWQMLDENFLPSLNVLGVPKGDLAVIDRCGDNLLALWRFMQRVNPSLHTQLVDDMRYLLTHVQSAHLSSDDRQTRLAIQENFGYEAPTVSVGTARIIAMLTAAFVLDMTTQPDTSHPMSGLVVIEEPDTALNPWVLGRLVRLLRAYTQREDAPRQFILTTHNPTFLNYFTPDEVRVVERGDDGYTTVKPIPQSIRDIWKLDDDAGEYGLGEVWTTGSLGGVAQ